MLNGDDMWRQAHYKCKIIANYGEMLKDFETKELIPWFSSTKQLQNLTKTHSPRWVNLQQTDKRYLP